MIAHYGYWHGSVEPLRFPEIDGKGVFTCYYSLCPKGKSELDFNPLTTQAGYKVVEPYILSLK